MSKPELSSEAKQLVKEEFDSLSARLQSSLVEIAVWNWIARIVFLAVLGGSIFGFLRFQDFLDDRIASRAATFDRIYLANSFVQSQQPRRALQEISSFMDAQRLVNTTHRSAFYEFDQLRLSSSQRNFFHLTVLGAVAQINDRDPAGLILGKDFWIALLDSSYFQTDFILGKQWESGEDISARLGLSYYKFARDAQDLHLALKFLDFASSQSNQAVEQYATYKMYCAAMLGDEESAVKFAKEMFKKWPSLHNTRPPFHSTEFATSFTSAQFAEALSTRLNITNFRLNIEKAWERADQINEVERIVGLIEKLREIDPTFSPESFKVYAIEKFRNNFERTYRHPFHVEDTTHSLYFWTSMMAKVAPIVMTTLSALDVPRGTDDPGAIEYAILQVTTADITDITVSKETASVVVKIDAKTRRTKNGQPRQSTHLWTFERPSGGQDTSWKIASIDDIPSFGQAGQPKN
ncbi:MAG: hypothetical protein R3D82_04605 [Xanthobacteraceae bacterium]